MLGLFCTYWYQFLYGNERKISKYCQSPHFTEMHGRQQQIHPIAIYFSFCVLPNNFKVKIPMSKNY